MRTTALDDLITNMLRASGRRSPSRDALAIAYDLGLKLKSRERDGATLVRDREIHYDRALTHCPRQRLVARELARWGLRRWRIEETDANVTYVAQGLVLELRALAKAAIVGAYVDQFLLAAFRA